MPRRRGVEKRKLYGDAKFGDRMVTRFTNCLMKDGKKAIAERVIYNALEIIAERTREDPLRVFNKAIENSRPEVEVRSRRVGGSTYQVPMEVRHDRQTALAIRWLIQFAVKRGGKTLEDKLANELIEAAHFRGAAIKKKEDVHRMAEANKAFAHYRW
jgi:small subunit ribosomal protein S7